MIAFQQVASLRQRDVLLCLHENGSVTTRIRRKTNVISTPASEGHGAFGKYVTSFKSLMEYNMQYVFL